MLIEATVRELYELSLSGTDMERDQVEYVFLQGWISAVTDDGMELNDGTWLDGARILCTDLPAEIPEGCAVSLIGKYSHTPDDRTPFLIRATEITEAGRSDPDYRSAADKAHMHMRRKYDSAMYRMRSVLTMSVHEFFQNQGFVCVNTPYGADDRLYAEAFSAAFRDVYTFGPARTADGERWKITAELAFAELDDIILLTEDLFRSCADSLRDNCTAELSCVSEDVPGAQERLDVFENAEYPRVTPGEEPEGKAPYFILYSDDARFPRARKNGENIPSAAELIVPGSGPVCLGYEDEERYDGSEDEVRRDLKRYGSMRHAGLEVYLEDLLAALTGREVKGILPFGEDPQRE